MKKRTNVVAEAALAFVSKLPKKPLAETAVNSVLPETTAELAEVKSFEQKTPEPKRISKLLCSTVVERVLTGKAKLPDAASILVATERDYVLNLLDEVYAWASAQGYEVRS